MNKSNVKAMKTIAKTVKPQAKAAMNNMFGGNKACDQKQKK